MIRLHWKYLIYACVFVFIFVIVGAFYNIGYVGPQLWGQVAPLEFANKLYEEEFSWAGMIPERFNMISGSFSDSKSKCNTVVCHFVETEVTKKNDLRVIVGKIDELLFLNSAPIVDDNNYHSTFSVEPEKTVERINNTYALYVPWTTYNTRLIPVGKRLVLHGLSNSTNYREIIAGTQIDVCEGDFNRIAFEVIPNNGFIKNYVKEMRFDSMQHGLILLVKDKNGKYAFVIFHCEREVALVLKDQKNELLKSLEQLKIAN